MDFEKALESLKTIKLTGGIFGKTTLLLVILCISLAAVALKIDVWWFALILLLPLMGLIFYALKRCFDFAEKNPQAAIMDGAELLIHERIVHGTKENKLLPSSEPVTDHQLPEITDEEISSEDPPPISQIEEKPNHNNKEDK